MPFSSPLLSSPHQQLSLTLSSKQLATMKIISTLKKPSSFLFGSGKKSKARSLPGQSLSFGSSTSSASSSSDDSKVSRRDLERVLRRLGPDPPSDQEIMTMLAEADRAGDGSISLDEITALGPPGVLGSDELRETFRVFDADGDGLISAEELLVMIGDEECGIEDCRRMIRVVDSDGDGFVCYEDFVKMMMDLQR